MSAYHQGVSDNDRRSNVGDAVGEETAKEKIDYLCTMNEEITNALAGIDELKERLSALRPLPEEFQMFIIEAEKQSLMRYLSLLE